MLRHGRGLFEEKGKGPLGVSSSKTGVRREEPADTQSQTWSRDIPGLLGGIVRTTTTGPQGVWSETDDRHDKIRKTCKNVLSF